MNGTIRQRAVALKEHTVEKVNDRLHGRGWKIPRQTTTFADDGAYSNIDSDVTPLERRTWTSWTILGFWCSDALNAQGWEAPSSIIAAGLTWREAVIVSKLFATNISETCYLSRTALFGSITDTIPLILNGIIGGKLFYK
jgi:NCS1 family nucleobase:cation symporter-1